MALPVKAPPSLPEILSVQLRKDLQIAIRNATMKPNPQKDVDKLLPLLEAVTATEEATNMIFQPKAYCPVDGRKTIPVPIAVHCQIPV